MAVWLWLVFPVTCWTVCSPCLMLRRVRSVTRRSTTTSHIFSRTSTGCKFRKEYGFNWPYSFSAAVTIWCPPYLLRDLQWTDKADSLRQLRSGSLQRLIIPRTRLRTIGDRSFCVTAARAWNSLPTSVTTATSLASFKRQLKTFLFTKSFP